MDEQALRRAVEDVLGLIQAKQQDEAVEKILAFRGTGDLTRDILIRALISTGQQWQSVEVTRCALAAFERVKAKASPDADYYYDVANGYQVLYDAGAGKSPAAPFDLGEEASAAVKYFMRALGSNPMVATNLGNLYDSMGRPIEALRAYEQALELDPEFAMALGNRGYALEVISPSSPHSGAILVAAYQAYVAALQREDSLRDVGGEQAIEFFRTRAEKITDHFYAIGKPDALTADLRHEPYDESGMTDFVRFYTELCIENDLYINLHLVDRRGSASVGDDFMPTLVTALDQDRELAYVRDITFRLNEIRESFATARYLFARSQYVDPDTRTLSEQTTLVNQLDYSASNLYVGFLKAAYKEAFSALDKVAVLLNHYLEVGHSEDSVYYGTVWFEPEDVADRVPKPRVSERIRAGGHRLLGLYLLCLDLRGSRYSQLRNAMTHRYVRVYRDVAGPKGTYLFEDLAGLTAEILYKVKCAIMYSSIFINGREVEKHAGLGPVGTIPMNTEQNLDLW